MESIQQRLSDFNLKMLQKDALDVMYTLIVQVRFTFLEWIFPKSRHHPFNFERVGDIDQFLKIVDEKPSSREEFSDKIQASKRIFCDSNSWVLWNSFSEAKQTEIRRRNDLIDANIRDRLRLATKAVTKHLTPFRAFWIANLTLSSVRDAEKAMRSSGLTDENLSDYDSFLKDAELAKDYGVDIVGDLD